MLFVEASGGLVDGCMGFMEDAGKVTAGVGGQNDGEVGRLPRRNREKNKNKSKSKNKNKKALLACICFM